MANYRVKPSKPVAVMGAIFGLAVMVVGLVTMINKDGPVWGMILWVVIAATITGFNLWAAFAKNGALQNIESDEPPVRQGMTSERS